MASPSRKTAASLRRQWRLTRTLAETDILEDPSDFYALPEERLLGFDRIGRSWQPRMVESIHQCQVHLRRAFRAIPET